MPRFKTSTIWRLNTSNRWRNMSNRGCCKLRDRWIITNRKGNIIWIKLKEWNNKCKSIRENHTFHLEESSMSIFRQIMTSKALLSISSVLKSVSKLSLNKMPNLNKLFWLSTTKSLKMSFPKKYNCS